VAILTAIQHCITCEVNKTFLYHLKSVCQEKTILIDTVTALGWAQAEVTG